MTKPILFVDFNGVISYNNFWHSIYAEDHEYSHLAKQINQFVFVENIEKVKSWMRGDLTSEDIHNLIEEKFGIPAQRLLEIFSCDAQLLDISAEILLKLKELRTKYQLVMITDNMDSFHRYTLPANQILSETFDRIYISAQTKKLKKDNNGEVFFDIAKELDSDIEDAILIDDSKSNTELFTTIGGKGIAVTGIENVLHALEQL